MKALSRVGFTLMLISFAALAFSLFSRLALMVPMGSDLRRYGIAIDSGRLYLRGEFDFTAASWPRAELITHPAALDWWFTDDRTPISRTMAVPLWAPACLGLVAWRLLSPIPAKRAKPRR
ncbi:MAG: hypothetical protein ACREJO_03895 [Phycisphaerales bacterium]